MDHSGIMISTDASRFRAVDSNGWDWCQIGIIYATLEAVAENFGVITDATKQQMRVALAQEIQEYNAYLTGDVYSYTIEKYKSCSCGECGRWSANDSCSGFYGDANPLTNGMMDNIVGTLEPTLRIALLTDADVNVDIEKGN